MPGSNVLSEIKLLKEQYKIDHLWFCDDIFGLKPGWVKEMALLLKEENIKAEYLHSDIKTLDRHKILTDLRKGTYDVIVGINLLREGIDLPEVSLVIILDADKEGFLRNTQTLIQTIGRAARNVGGRVILYADQETESLKKAVGETNRRRAIQIAYNTQHGITPTTIKKNISDITESMQKEGDVAVAARARVRPGRQGGLRSARAQTGRGARPTARHQ